ncbi:MAG: hypothetical protein AB2653_10325, partial [Candidatus Thiodiazotropha endolucinida]
SFLASKLDGMRALGDEVFRAADLVDWEMLTANRASYLIEQGSYKKAEKMMAERTERSEDSPLLPLEAQVVLARGDYRAAKRIVERGLEATALGGDRRVRFDLLMRAAALAERQGDVVEQVEMLEAAATLARSLDERLKRVELLVQVLECNQEPEASHARARLSEAIAEVDPSELRGHPDLVSRLAAYVPIEGPAVRRLLEGTDEDQLAAGVQVIAGELQPLLTIEEIRNLVQKTVNEAGYRSQLSDQESTFPLVEQMGKEHKLRPSLVTLATTASQLTSGNSNRLLGAITGMLASYHVASQFNKES